jgi:hypothetical protein
MVPGTKNIKAHWSGDTWRGITFRISTVDSQGTKTPVDLTGARVDMHVKKEPTDRKSVLQFSTEDSTMQISDAVGGVVTVLPMVVEEKAQEYYYDLQVTDTNGVVTTYVQGSWEIVQDVTRL